MDNNDFYGINLAKLLEKHNIPGVSIAISRDGNTETYCCGTGRIGANYEITENTLFQAGSVSKTVFSAVIMRLFDKKIVDINADISNFVSDFVDTPVTFRQLLSHTAGFNVHGFDGYPVAEAPVSLQRVLSGGGNSDKLERNLPSGEFSYSGGGYELAELAIARITGRTLQELAKKEVFEPLEMENSGFFQPLDKDKIKFAAFAGPCEGEPLPADGFMYHPELAAAGLWTTPTDLIKFGLALGCSGKHSDLLGKRTAQLMLTPLKENYGLGVKKFVQFDDDIYDHYGSNIGYETFMIFSIENPFALAVCVNANNCESCFNELAEHCVVNEV